MLQNINCQHVINEASDVVRDFQMKATEWLGRAVVVIKPVLEKGLHHLQNKIVPFTGLFIFEIVLFKSLDRISQSLLNTLPGGTPLKDKIKGLIDSAVSVSGIVGGIYGCVKVTNLPLQLPAVLGCTAVAVLFYGVFAPKN